MLGIVVVSYRSDEMTVRFVREELSRIRIPYHLAIVDNGGREEGEDGLSARLPEATVLLSENRGYACGCNLGAAWLREHVRPEAILFTNTDLRFRTVDVADVLYSVLLDQDEAGAVGPEIIGTDGRRQSPEPYRGLWNRYVWMYLSTPFLSEKRKEGKFRLDYAQKASEGFHYKLMGSFLMVRTEDFFRAGCFDEHTFLYAEEPILSERLLSIGKRCYFYPGVTVVHEHGAVIGSSFEKRKRELMQLRSMSYYYRKYKGYPAWQVALASLLYRMILLVK